MSDRPFALSRRLVAEAVGTAVLLAAIIGSAAMVTGLTDNDALRLFAISTTVGAVLFVLISTLGPISGAHFNPAVTLAFWLRGDIAAGGATSYIAAQIGGALIGAIVVHLTFGFAPLGSSVIARSGASQFLGEGIATYGLMAAILLGLAFRPKDIAWLVALWIAAGHWFTASTSFANPAVTIARSFTGTITGIRSTDAPAFILVQLASALLAVLTIGWLLKGNARDGKSTR